MAGPTSVFTGLLGLDVRQMLLGSIPVVLIIAPCVGLGAALSMGDRPGWDGITKLLALVSLAAQLGVTVGFGAVIARASTVHAAAIAELPLDKEVAALDAHRQMMATAWRTASDWRQPGHVPMLVRVLLATGAAAIIVGCHLTVCTRPFARVTVADRFDRPPINGHPLNVVLGVPGAMVLVDFAFASLVLVGYRIWLARRAAQLVKFRPAAVPAPAVP